MRHLIIGLLLAAPLAHAQSAETLYQDLGGEAGVARIVDAFVPRVRSDARIQAFFAKTDVAKLSTLLKEQFCQLSDGPCKYSGRDMASTHDGMGVKTADFNALAEDLQITMDELGVAPSTAARLMARLAPMHKAVVR